MNQMLFNTPSQSSGSMMGGNLIRDLSAADLSSHMGVVASRGAGGLNVQFFYVRVRTKSRNSQSNGQMQTRLCVAKQPKGDRYTVAIRYISDEQAQREFPREYAAFKQYEDVPTSGTSLDQLPGITQSQIGMLVINGLRSIEDLAEMNSDQIGQLGYEAVAAHRLAVAWVARRDGDAETIKAAEIEAAAQLENKTLRDRMKAMEEANMRLQAKLDALSAVGGAAPASSEPMPVESKSDLPYELDKMPDPLSEGEYGMATGNDDLGEIDPLAD